jgi:hypothetical protein
MTPSSSLVFHTIFRLVCRLSGSRQDPKRSEATTTTTTAQRKKEKTETQSQHLFQTTNSDYKELVWKQRAKQSIAIYKKNKEGKMSAQPMETGDGTFVLLS